MPPRLQKDFFNQTCDILAKTLLGQVLCRRIDKDTVLRGRILETEMYPGNSDKASHSFNSKKTRRNKAMFMEPGTAYIYFIYGMYFCFNISSHETGGCVLIRSLEPLEGLEQMKIYRSRKRSVSSLKDTDLCSGPSKLCQAFRISIDQNEVDLCTSDEMWLEEGVSYPSEQIYASKRVGIESSGSESANRLYRFYVRGNPHVSVIDSDDEMSPRKRRKLSKSAPPTIVKSIETLSQ